MSKFKHYLASMRLRTLPLSLAGVIMGALLAVADYRVQALVVVLLMATTVCLRSHHSFAPAATSRFGYGIF